MSTNQMIIHTESSPRHYRRSVRRAERAAGLHRRQLDAERQLATTTGDLIVDQTRAQARDVRRMATGAMYEATRLGQAATFTAQLSPVSAGFIEQIATVAGNTLLEVFEEGAQQRMRS